MSVVLLGETYSSPLAPVNYLLLILLDLVEPLLVAWVLVIRAIDLIEARLIIGAAAPSHLARPSAQRVQQPQASEVVLDSSLLS